MGHFAPSLRTYGQCGGGWGGGGSIFKLISEVFLENYGSRRGVGGGVQEMGGGCGHHHRHTKEKKKSQATKLKQTKFLKVCPGDQ